MGIRKGGRQALYGVKKQQNRPYGGPQSGNAQGGDQSAANGGGSASTFVQAPRKKTTEEIDRQEASFGFWRFTSGAPKLGWLLTFAATSVVDEETQKEMSAVDFYFLQQDGSKFKATKQHRPYFYIYVEPQFYRDTETFIRRKFKEYLADIIRTEVEDLDMPNHLAGIKNVYMRLVFFNVKDLVTVRNELSPIVQRNMERKTKMSLDISAAASNAANSIDPLANGGAGGGGGGGGGGGNAAAVASFGVGANVSGGGVISAVSSSSGGGGGGLNRPSSPKRTRANHESLLNHITDMREFDVPYPMRVCIDCDIRVGKWYNISVVEGEVTFVPRPELDVTLGRAEPCVLAWDIECTKLPLKFPDAKSDSIFMISYMVDGQGFLIVDREVVCEDIPDFEYTPKPEMPGTFTVFNEPNELSLIRRFLDHIRELRPSVFVSYNGDFFDWPFLEQRCEKHGINMEEEIGFVMARTGEYMSRFASHIDCLAWVKRDSYLPQGSHGLKAVAKAKLDYDPVQIEPEEMVPLARSAPQTMATYSVSDAIATYYLYMKYIHPFIFSLCNIIPMSPDDVLRKGSGTLCETLLMVEAYKGGIICPNKHADDAMKYHKGHLLDGETYIGGHVEALQSGVFRADIPLRFRLDPTALDELIGNIDRDLRFAIEVEGGLDIKNVTNYNEVRERVVNSLLALKEAPKREENPSILHLDVGAMYPNIILTNRLQPPAMVSPADCASCDFYSNNMRCRRELQWFWRGDYFPSSVAEVRQLQGQMERDQTGDDPGFQRLKQRVKTYCQKVYKKSHVTVQEPRTAYICQRENSFYVDTVRAFKERRYEYKALQKGAFGALKKAEHAGDAMGIADAEKQVVLYESLQLAHKCILNSFYGYVMRKGARWYSMPMAGVVTAVGARIIQNAKELVERIGIPLELDTDGIWCALPKSFPGGLEFTHVNPKSPGVVNKFVVSYACEMLNAQVNAEFTNDQYHELVDKERRKYEIKSECSILFEVDGPYKAMVLPASKEEDKKLKKRYAVFNFNGTLAELKGFEIKRRGELSLIKIFQSEVFKRFLDGTNLEECYDNVAQIANRWLDVLDTRGAALEDEELVELLSESSTMSKSIEEYGDRKSTAMTTAKRLGEFLGEAMLQDKGLACKYVICDRPMGAPVTDRAVPTAIFSADLEVRRQCLRRWTRDTSLSDDELDVRHLLDWNYYKERLGGVIQKIITIPAALQGVPNPVPRVVHPDWLQKRLLQRTDPRKQTALSSFFGTKAGRPSNPAVATGDIEDMASSAGGGGGGKKLPLAHHHNRHKNDAMDVSEEGDDKAAAKTAAAANAPPPLSPRSAAKKKEEEQEATGVALPSEVTRLTDFDRWLAFNKKKWRRQIADKQKRKAGEESGPNRRLRGTALGAFFHSQGSLLTSKSWQIIQIAPTQTGGIFRFWVILPDGSVTSLALNVKRTFYVNRRSPPDNEEERCIRKLPFELPMLHLTEHCVEEQDYQAYAKDLSTSIAAADVEGVYETQVPLLFRAICQLGCVCSVRPNSELKQKIIRDNAVPAEVRMEDLDFRNTVDAPYLQGDTVPRKAVLYYSYCDRRGLFVLALPDEPVQLIFVNPYRSGTSRPDMRRIVREQLRLRGKDPENEPESQFEFHQRTETSVQKACKIINQRLLNFPRHKDGPTLVLKISTMGSEEMVAMLPILIQFPVLSLAGSAEDNQYPALAWEIKAAQKFMQSFLSVESSFETYLQLSRYVHVPVGNLDASDIPSFSIDVMYSRALMANNMVLWASPSSLPDLAGNETAEAFQWPDEPSPQISHPGAYREFCVSIDVSALAVSAISHHKELDESTIIYSTNPHEKGEVAAMEASLLPRTEVIVDETTAANDAFKILEKLVMSWIRDVFRGSHVADWMQTHVARWLSAPNSLFRASVLQRHVWRTMNKLFQFLLAQFVRLGCQIVYASLSKIIIATKKTKLESARVYCDYIIQTIRSESALSLVSLTPQVFWSSLLFVDAYNFGGVQAYPLLDLPNDDEDDDEEDEDGNPRKKDGADMQVVFNWNLAEHLPPAMQALFANLVKDFMVLPLRLRKKLGSADDGRDDAEEDGNDGDDPTPSAMRRRTRPEIAEKERAFLERLVSTSASEEDPELHSETFFRRIASRIESLPTDQPFPEMPAPSREMTDPVLEVVKSVCFVLSLDTHVNVAVMKRALLQLLRVREFAAEAEFKNPSRSVIVPNHFCNGCAACSDLDLCRDPSLIAGEWICENCQQPYDKNAIEERVVEMCKRIILQHQQQDLRCVRCRHVPRLLMSTSCRCSGRLNMDHSETMMKHTLETMYMVAKYHDMPLLENTVRWAMDSLK